MISDNIANLCFKKTDFPPCKFLRFLAKNRIKNVLNMFSLYSVNASSRQTESHIIRLALNPYFVIFFFFFSKREVPLHLQNKL